MKPHNQGLKVEGSSGGTEGKGPQGGFSEELVAEPAWTTDRKVGGEQGSPIRSWFKIQTPPRRGRVAGQDS